MGAAADCLYVCIHDINKISSDTDRNMRITVAIKTGIPIFVKSARAKNDQQKQ